MTKLTHVIGYVAGTELKEVFAVKAENMQDLASLVAKGKVPHPTQMVDAVVLFKPEYTKVLSSLPAIGLPKPEPMEPVVVQPALSDEKADQLVTNPYIALSTAEMVEAIALKKSAILNLAYVSGLPVSNIEYLYGMLYVNNIPIIDVEQYEQERIKQPLTTSKPKPTAKPKKALKKAPISLKQKTNAIVKLGSDLLTANYLKGMNEMLINQYYADLFVDDIKLKDVEHIELTRILEEKENAAVQVKSVYGKARGKSVTSKVTKTTK